MTPMEFMLYPLLLVVFNTSFIPDIDNPVDCMFPIVDKRIECHFPILDEQRDAVVYTKNVVNNILKEEVVFVCFIDYVSQEYRNYPKDPFNGRNEMMFLDNISFFEVYYSFRDMSPNYQGLEKMHGYNGFAFSHPKNDTRDIYLNRNNIYWDDGSWTEETIKLLTHEILHLFGFSHNSTSGNVMYPRSGEKRGPYPTRRDVLQWTRSVEERVDTSEFVFLQEKFSRMQKNNCEDGLPG